MENFEWAEQNLRVNTPDELQAKHRVNVYFAPNIAATKIVDLGTGRVDWMQPEEERPQEGYFAEFDSLEAYFRREGIPLAEVDGFVSVQPFGRGEAGDPLRRHGH